MHRSRSGLHHHDDAHAGAGAHSKALCVSLVPIFNHLPEDELENVAACAHMRTLEKDAFIHRAGMPADQLFIVHAGRVKVYRLAETGKEQLVRMLGPGDFLGELNLFNDGCHESYAQATETSQICSIAQRDLRELLLRYPAIGLHVMAELAHRLGSTEKQAAAIGTESIDTRLGRYLLKLAAASGSNAIHLPFSHRDLASYLGITPETLSRRLTAFEVEGWIKRSGPRNIVLLLPDRMPGAA
ncbi:Crp/Fnr family transcriptional regulator [Paracandidimonas lactea]|uniref:Crp/Fnr family transcriptional regulator n=1 Tax=Paracandidimonas lactea TaxID=2895524 RepID=UPI001F28FA0A|nr:Crp/Fnr family transcriptional regulator [Paracandidimonas lactea]